MTSIIVACRDMASQLCIALGSWLPHEEVKEIVLVDWSSREPLSQNPDFQALKKSDSAGKICLIQVDCAADWHPAAAYNLAASLAAQPRVLKLDPVHSLHPDFFLLHPLLDGIFYAGNCRAPLYASRVHFFTVGGYNEYLQSAEWQDADLCERLTAIGLSKRSIAQSGPCVALSLQSHYNRLLAAHLPWSAKQNRCEFQCATGGSARSSA